MKTHKLLPAALVVAGLLAGCPGTAGTGPAGALPGASAAPGQPAALALSAVKQIPVGKAPHGIWAAGGFAYNADVGDARISVIDAATDAVVKTIPLPDGAPGYMKAFHDGKHMMALDTKQGTLLVIDPAQDHKVLQTVAIGKGPDKIAVDGDTIVVSCALEPKAVQLTFAADRSQPPTKKEFAIGANGTEHRAISVGGGWAVAPNPGDNNVSLIPLLEGATKTVSGGNNPAPVGLGTTDGKAVAAIVGNAASNTVTVFALPGGEATTLDGTGLSPTDMGLDPATGRAFISMAGSNDLAVVDYVGKKLLGRIPTGNRPVHVYMPPVLAGSTQEVWVGNDAGASVTIVDAATLRVKATVATDQGHHKMAFWGTKGYVSNITANNVSVVDRTQVK